MRFALVVLLVATAAVARAGGEEWKQFGAGQRIEVDAACTGTWSLGTILKVEERSHDKSYTVKLDNGHEWSFGAPGIVAPCVRAIGGIAHDRATFGTPALGVYTCNYRGQIAPVFDFALLDNGTYRDYDGNRGTYRYDATQRQVVFVTGPKQGFRAQQISTVTFQIINVDGKATGNFCPFNARRDPNGKRL